MTECCSQCGAISNDIYEILPDEWLCVNCFNEYTRDSIRAPHANPALEFYGYSDNGRFYGFELEMMDGLNPTLMAGRLNYALPEIFTTRDGSVPGGFEMVTQPCTLEYHESMDYTRFFSLCENKGYKSHDASRSCGLHIHVSRVPQSDNQVGGQLYLIHKFWSLFVKFSRRKGSDINQWAGKYQCINIDDSFQTIYSRCQHESQMGYQYRYRNINLQNTSTIEYRIFRGSLKRDTVIASIQFVDLLCEITGTLSEQEIRDLTWGDIVRKGSKYKELKNYFSQRGL